MQRIAVLIFTVTTAVWSAAWAGEVNVPCCLPDGSCVTTGPATCESQTGIVFPEAPNCAAVICVGCCEGLQLDVCLNDTPLAACERSGGTGVVGGTCSNGDGNAGECAVPSPAPALGGYGLAAALVTLLGVAAYRRRSIT